METTGDDRGGCRAGSASTGVFDATHASDRAFTGCRWLSHDVLRLAPVQQQFRGPTAAVVDTFPGYPPYGGAFDEVLPHLTIAESRHAEPTSFARWGAP